MNEKYSMSFTSGALLHQESVDATRLFLELGDWHTVRDRVISENLIQARTKNTLNRVCKEILSRLRTLSPAELQFLAQGSDQDQRHLLWLAVCRRYRFIAEFATEVVRERFLSLKYDLQLEDFDAFFNKKADWCPELDKIKPSTRIKLRQVLFKMLRESGLLGTDNRINAALLAPALVKAITCNRRQDLLVFPAFELDIVPNKKDSLL